MAYRSSSSRPYDSHPPVYREDKHSSWEFQMEAYFKTRCALSLQILRNEICLNSSASETPTAPHSNSESLAMKRSQSYTLSARSQLSDLLGGAPSSESPDSSGSSSTDYGSDVTIPYGDMSPAPAPGVPSADKPESAGTADVPEGTSRAGTRETPPPQPGEKTGGRTTPVGGEDQFVTPAQRRSRRLRGEKPKAQDGLRKSIRAASRRSARRATRQEQDTEEEDKDESSEDEHKGPPDAEAGAPGAPAGEPGEPPHPGEPDAASSSHSESADDFARYMKQMERRMSRLKMKLRKERRRSRSRSRRRGIRSPKRYSGTFKGIVDRAKAIRELVKHTISPELWDALPPDLAAEAYNYANNFAWDAIKASLGYEHSHLLGQLREGDGKAAWIRMITLHAETTMGAQAHFLAKLMNCSYNNTVGLAFGDIRLYAEALQKINNKYKLASGKFVQPDILMSRLLTLPSAYDQVIHDVETEIAARRREGQRTLDFPTVLARLVAHENRLELRSKSRRRKGQAAHAVPRHHHRASRRSEHSRSWRRERRRPARSRGQAFTAQGHNGIGNGKIVCWRCGKEGHRAAECKETHDVNGRSLPQGRGQYQFKPATVRMAGVSRKPRGQKRPGRSRRSPPSRGFLAREVQRHDQALSMENTSKKKKKLQDTVVIDTGATIHCCVKGTKLANARATRKVIQAAGSQTLDACTAGDWGKLVDTVAVAGLRSALASAGRLADHYQAALIFTPKSVLALPLDKLKAALGGQADVVGHRAADGLYKANINRVNKVFDCKRGYGEPRSVAVGALAQSIENDQSEQDKSAEVLHALAAWHINDNRGSFRRPKLRRFKREAWGPTSADRAWRGVRRTHPPTIGGPTRSVPGPTATQRPDGRRGSKIRFVDLCAGLGGFTMAGIVAGWEPLASIDHCQSMKELSAWNFQHPYECVDLTKPTQVRPLRRRFAGVDVCLFSPPCQPYSLAGQRRPGDPRAQVAVAGINLILGWRPRLIVIECVAAFVNCRANPTYQKELLPRLTQAGYKVYVARCNAAQCGIPVRRDRVFIVCTLYQRTTALEEHMEHLSKKPMMPLAAWFPELKLVSCQPCHSSPAVFDARTSPHPTMRTGSLIPVMKKNYKARRGDAGSIHDATELSLGQKLKLAGLGPGFHWPKEHVTCRRPCCRRYAKSRWGGTLMSRGFGNIVVVEQALAVLRLCEVKRPRAWTALNATPVEARVNPKGPPKAVSSGGRKRVGRASACPVLVRKSKPRRKMPDRGLTMSSKPADTAERVLWLHRRFGHASQCSMLKMLKEASADSPEWRGITPADIKSMGFCETCARSKLTKQPHGSLRDRERMRGVNLLVHTDTMQRAVPSIPSKDIYVQSFVDDCSRYAWIETFQRKTFEGFSEMLTRAEARIASQFIGSAEYRSNGGGSGVRPVQRYFTDHASEMISAKQRHRLARSFIDLTVVAPSAKLSNGVAERFNRTVIDLARCLMTWGRLPIVFWAQAFKTAVFIYNRTPHTANGGKSPYRIYYGREHTDGDRLRVFGCKCYVHEEKTRRDHRSKLDPTARECVYLGPSLLDNRSHEYFNPRTNRVLRSTSIVFDEKSPGGPTLEGNSMIQKRMKNLVANKWKSRRVHSAGNQGDAPSTSSTDGGSRLAAGSSKQTREYEIESSEEDTWNVVYKSRDDDTMADIAARFGIGLEELRDHNIGMEGCNPVTGKTDPLAKLQEGTGLWLPDDCLADAKADRTERLPPTSESEAEEDRAGDPPTTSSDAEGSSAGRKLSRPKKAEGRWGGRLRRRQPIKKPEAMVVSQATAEGLRPHQLKLANEPRKRSWVSDALGDLPVQEVVYQVETKIKAMAGRVARLMARGNSEGSVRKTERAVRAAEDLFAFAAQTQAFIEKSNVPGSLDGIAARDVPTPKSYKEALSGQFADHWNKAVLKELDNLKSHGVYRWVERPAGASPPIDATWAWRVKPTAAGGVHKLKARVVARGFKERHGVSFAETFAPVTTLTTWRACLAEASHHKMKISIWDVSSAYLLSDIPKETPIYVEPFEGLTPPKGMKVTSRTCLQLVKSLYGLRAAGRLWNATIDARLKELGCRQSQNDPCLYIKEEGDKKIRLNLHVDDCCATYSDEDFYDSFMKKLESRYKLSAAADNNMFLGMQIERTRDGGVQVHQQHYIEETLKRFNATEWKCVPTPARDSIALCKEQSPQTEEERQRMAKVPYRQVVGSLMWLAVCSRPDLAQALGACARFCAAPGEEHWKALKWILRYLKGTKDLCLRYGAPVPDMPYGALHGNVDSSWGDDLDDRKSTTGYNFISYGGPIVWRSQKQKSVALSSCESEFIAANEAGREAIWLKRLYEQDFGYSDLSVATYGDLSDEEFRGARPLTIFEDNAGCIALSRNPVAHRRSKHIEIRYHWLRDKVRAGELVLRKIDTKLNSSDIHTKPTKKSTFLFLRDKLVHPREVPNGAAKPALLVAQEHKTPPHCNVCGMPGHLEQKCPLLFRPDELKEEEQIDTESKDSESLLVARPDGQHKGSNDPGPRLPVVDTLALALMRRWAEVTELITLLVEDEQPQAAVHFLSLMVSHAALVAENLRETRSTGAKYECPHSS